MMTYISYYRDYEEKRGQRDAEARIRRTPVADQCRAHGPGLEVRERITQFAVCSSFWFRFFSRVVRL